MKLEMPKVLTKDSIYLTGILSTPDTTTNKIIIHIHGMSGDIYSNSYYPLMHKEYTDAGIAFLCTENRGTHSITQFATNNGDLKNIGNAFEIFEESKYDILAWVSKAQEMGYSEIWLQSHSLGPSKVAYFVDSNPDVKVYGLLFISPTDVLGLINHPDNIENHEFLKNEATQLVKEGRGQEILSKELLGDTKMCANTYLNFFGDDSNLGIFNFSNINADWSIINSINMPVLSITGTKDLGIAGVIDPYVAMEKLEKELVNSPKVKTVVLKDAEHDFEGFEQEIVDEVIKFISS